MKILMIMLMATLILLQPTINMPASANGSHFIASFTTKKEVFLYELESKTSKKVFEVKEKGYSINYDSIKSMNGKFFFTMEDDRKSGLKPVPGESDSLTHISYQTGIRYQKEYMISTDGSIKLVRTIEIEALSPDVVEIRETALDSPTDIKIQRVNNRKSFINGPGMHDQIVEREGIRLIVEKRTLFIQRIGEDRVLLVSIGKEFNYKIAWGCFDPSINYNGTKGLCSYFPAPYGPKTSEVAAILEIDLLTNQITWHKEIAGSKPTFSMDDSYILYKCRSLDRYEVFNIWGKTIIKLPKSEHAFWFY